MKKIHSLFILLLWSSGFLLAQQSPDCEENVDAVDTTTVIANTLQASNTLTVNRKLNSGDTLRLIGGQLIELLPGFEADEGSYVEGENGECIDLTTELEPRIVSFLFDRQNRENDYIAFHVVAVDGMENPYNVLFEAVNLPEGITIDEQSGIVSGVIATGAAENSIYSSTIIVKDKFNTNLASSVSFYWTIDTRSGNASKNDLSKSSNFGIECVPLPVGNSYGELSVNVTDSNDDKCDYEYRWYKGDINSTPRSELELVATTTTNVLSVEELGLGAGIYSVEVFCEIGGTSRYLGSCSDNVGRTTNACKGNCLTLGLDLPNSDEYCYNWTAIGNKYVTGRTIEGEPAEQTPDPIVSTDGSTAEVCPTFPQYYDVVVSDGLNIVVEERYFVETRAITDLEVKIEFPEGGEVCESDGTTLELTATAGSGNYTFEWGGAAYSDADRIIATTLGNYNVTATDENGCSGTTTIVPPVCDEDIDEAVVEIGSCALDHIMLDPNANGSPTDHDCSGLQGNLMDFTGGTGSTRGLAQSTINHYCEALQRGQELGSNAKYIISNAKDCPTDSECPAKSEFNQPVPSGVDVVYWVNYIPADPNDPNSKPTALMQVKFSDDFFTIDDLSPEEQEAATKEMKAAYIAGLKEQYDCSDGETCEQYIKRVYENPIKPAKGDNPDCTDGTSCLGCISTCVNADGFFPEGFGVRFKSVFGSGDCNREKRLAEERAIMNSIRKDKKLPDFLWKSDGDSFYYIDPYSAGIIDAILQENPITSILELWKLINDKKTWETIQKAFEQPVKETMSDLAQFGSKLWAGLVKQTEDFGNRLCAQQGCDVMLHAQGKLKGTIGMLVLDFIYGGKGTGKLLSLFGKGAGAVTDAIGSWYRRLNNLPDGQRQDFLNKLDDVFDCPPVPTPDPINQNDLAKSGNSGNGCDLLRDFMKSDFGEDWDKIMRDPKLVDAWKAISKYEDLRINPLLLESVASYMKRTGKSADEIAANLDCIAEADRLNYLKKLETNGLQKNWTPSNFSSYLDNLIEGTPSPSGSLAATKFSQGIPYPPKTDEMKKIVDDITANGDIKGLKTEKLMDEMMNDAGYVKLNGQFGSNNGFDGVYIKESVDNITEIVIGDAKPWRSPSGGTKLGKISGGIIQMSDDWIDDVIERMKLYGDPHVAQLIESNIAKVTKMIVAVDKQSGNVNIAKLGMF